MGRTGVGAPVYCPPRLVRGHVECVDTSNPRTHVEDTVTGTGPSTEESRGLGATSWPVAHTAVTQVCPHDAGYPFSLCFLLRETSFSVSLNLKTLFYSDVHRDIYGNDDLKSEGGLCGKYNCTDLGI